MPVFDYECGECRMKYDIYHKRKEIVEDVICPSCGSQKHKRLMSIPGASVMKKGGMERCQPSSCDQGNCGCAGGACGLN